MKKLQLNKETLKALDADLSIIVGGALQKDCGQIVSDAGKCVSGYGMTSCAVVVVKA